MSSTCPTCGAKTVEYKFTLNTGLVSCLSKLQRAGGEAQVSSLGLTNSQYVNFQKLAWWSLVEKVEEPNGETLKRGGKWRITTSGLEFLQGQIRLSKTVWTYRGIPQRFDDNMIMIDDIEDGYQYRHQYAEQATPRSLT